MTTKLLNSLAAATTLAGMILTAGAANAASLTYSSTAFTSFELTDIVDSVLSIEQFDSSLGKLKSVKLDFTSNLTGTAGFENTGGGASIITVTLGAEVNLTKTGLDLSPPFPINPSTEQSYLVPAFDTILDFGGTSGQTIPGLTATGSTSKMFTDLSDLAIFTGTGNIDFLYTAIAKSSVTGPGNIASFVTTLAKADLKITYNYYKTVPEPSAALGIGLFAGIGLLSQRKKNWFKISNS